MATWLFEPCPVKNRLLLALKWCHPHLLEGSQARRGGDWLSRGQIRLGWKALSCTFAKEPLTYE